MIDLTQENFRLHIFNGANKDEKSKVEKENVSLVEKGKKKKGSRKGSNSQSEKKNKDLSNFKCFCCQEYGHYINDYPKRKKSKKKRKKQVVPSIMVEDIYTTMEDQFALIACMVSLIP